MGRDDQRQAVKNIPLEQLKPFKNHPFQVRDDEEFRRLVESIEIHGVIHPAVARQIGAECYELISGHRRKAACEVLGYSEMPVLVRSMTDDEAVVNMVDANLQRETILPSERAFAYKMKLVAMSHQGRKGFTSAQLGRKCVGKESRELIAEQVGQSRNQISRYIMDEASQCNTAVSLVPILRGESLMLVGDPQQLQPVILLDPHDNEVLRRRYHVSEEYDYIQNSIYKCFLACDAVSDEVLLRYHYRCDPKIIGFNNRKYYNQKLKVASEGGSKHPLVFVDVSNNTSTEKNVAPAEVAAIDRYLTRNPERSVGIITPFANQREQIEQMLKEHGHKNASCGTVHAFQGDEKDVVLFSLALTDKTSPKTYSWLRNNKELINVATSRAREQLIVLSSSKELERLHANEADDDLYDLYQYVRTSGVSKVAPKPAASRALGIKPYSTKTESAFLENLNHALDNVFVAGSRCVVRREVSIAHVFRDNPGAIDLFYTGRFDFVVYQREGRQLTPVLAIELDGREHRDDPVVQTRDAKKARICQEHGFELIRVDNTYARRYHYIKEILIRYFDGK